MLNFFVFNKGKTVSISSLDHYELIQELTSGDLTPVGTQQQLRLNDFATELGWRPSDQLSLPGTEDFSAGHLVVEHGLRNSAVISFLRRPIRYPDLGLLQQKALLNASYNNLIDWHITIDCDSANYIYNRVDPPRFFFHRHRLARGQTSHLSSQEFSRLSKDHPTPNVPALDTALIKTISLWKRQLSAELTDLKNEEISNLFNSLILVRALEDHQDKSNKDAVSLYKKCLEDPHPKISALLNDAITLLGVSNLPKGLFDRDKFGKFDSLEKSTLLELIKDFYENRYEPYFDYNFSIMSKHALSRIYEHYVSLLRFPETAQKSFLPILPEETIERAFGNVYTPEFIARFFAKYVQKELSLSRFQKTRIGDPACGSGIFLRTMLEAKFDTFLNALTTQDIAASFNQLIGIDIDENACAAARLSLSLLSLVRANSVPSALNIVNADTIEYYQKHPELKESIDIVAANPPFVNIEDLPTSRRDLLLTLLGDKAKGKTDLYLGLLQISLAMLKDDGFGLFVLPKNFLISDNAGPIRDAISKSSIVLAVVDLSSVKVFEEVGSYVVLLIFQKHSAPVNTRPVLVVRCNDLIGAALEDALQEREMRTPAYEIFWSGQPQPGNGSWDFVPPERAALDIKLQKLPLLGDFAEIRQGIITGADDIFIVSAAQIPRKEKAAYVPFLPDREITPYRLPDETNKYVIYPFRGAEALDEITFRQSFPETWEYLVSHRTKLKARRSGEEGRSLWWRPNRPRDPKKLFQPKIVTPHLVISPRFALDSRGKFAVSHTPYILVRQPGSVDELMFLLGVLNSTPCFWLVTQSAHIYSRGYSRLEVSTLNRVRIPDPAEIDGSLVREIIRLVRMRLKAGKDSFEIEHLLDDRVADAYGLNDSEKRLMGM
jgi:type I restriction-modification system DNA methylase subunit